MNYILNDNINSLSPQELDNLKGSTSNIQTQLNQISPNVGTIVPLNEIINTNDTLNVLANKTQGQINDIKSNGGGVSANSIQTLTNKTLNSCDANTQPLTDNSTKIATTNYVNQQIAANLNGENVIIKLNVAEIDNNLNPLLIGETSSTITIGSLSNIDNKVINIGGANDVVNILGSTNFIQTTNTKVQNKVMILNDGAVGNNQSAGTGIHFKDNDVSNKGYMIVGANGTSLDFKAPQNDNVFKIKENPTDNYDLTNKLYVDSKSTNNNFTNCTANTQLTTDNSTKIATTAFITNKLSGPNTYVGTVLSTIPSGFLNQSVWTDYISITIPVNGTYEINVCVNSISNVNGTLSHRLFNMTTGLVIPNTTNQLYRNDNSGYTGSIVSRLLILENLTANTVIKLQLNCSGTCYVYEGSQGTSLSYKMLGLTTNVISPLIWTARSSAIGNFNMSFGINNFYTLSWDSSLSDFIIKTATNITARITSIYINTSGGIFTHLLNGTTLTNSFLFSTSSMAGFNSSQTNNGDFYDITNNRHFRITIIGLYDGRPYFLVEQLSDT